jgi:outer membrane protein assembly factor BamB
MSQQLTSAPVAASKPRRRRRFIFPAILTLVIVAAFLTLPGGRWLDVDPETLMNVVMIAEMVVVVSLVLLLVWFLAFSGFRWYTRVLGLLLLALCAGGAVAAVRRIEFSGEWKPMAISFRWQQDPETELDAALEPWTNTDSLPPINLTVDPVSDFPRYRGLNADGVVLLRTLDTDWNARSPTPLWKHRCGGGYAGFAVAGNVAVTIEQRHEKEAIVCWDRATGKQRWVYEYPDLFHRNELMGGDGPRATPTIDNGDVFSLGANGRLVCLDGANGKEKWTADILKDNGAENIDWGMSGSPLVVGNLVIVNPGINLKNNVGHALAAYDRATGKTVWQSGEHAAAYSSPQLATVAGVDQILLFDAGGLAGHDPKTGKELWRQEWTTMVNMNIIQPVVIGGDRILIASEPTGCAMVQVRHDQDRFTAELLWKNRKIGMKFSNPIAANGFIYGLSYEKLVCLDQETGKLRWKGDEYGAGQLLVVGGVLLVTSESGEVALVAAQPDAFHEFAKMDVLGGKTWNTPALAGNQLFLRNHKEMTCLELPLAEK